MSSSSNTSTTESTSSDWKGDLDQTITQCTLLVCWLAIIIDPLFFIADYLTIPAHWIFFLGIRLSVSLIVLTGVLLRKKINMRAEVLLLLPGLGISIQNAYMWSIMDLPMLQKHTFAYATFFVGWGMLVIWRPVWSVVLVGISLIANILFLRANSNIPIQDFLINGGMLVTTIAVLSGILIQSRYALSKRAIRAKFDLAASNKQLVIKNQVIEEKNKDITDSINYAKRIQEAILPSIELSHKLFPHSFILFKPRDIVSGDFYWFTEKNGKKFIAAVDCTGHGVPGAFMSMIGNTFLNQVVNEKGITAPGEILDKLREMIIEALKQTGADGENRDGMDISLICVDVANSKVEFAGANNPLWIIRNKSAEVEETKGNKQPIGIYVGQSTAFTDHEIQLNKGDSIYIFTDGFADQMGGQNGKKYKYKTLKELLLSLQGLPMEKQEQKIRQELSQWQGAYDQTDDILLIGVRV